MYTVEKVTFDYFIFHIYMYISYILHNKPVQELIC